MSMSLSMSLSLGGPTAAPAAPAPGGLLFDADFLTATYTLGGVAAVIGDLFIQTDYGPFVPATDITASGLVSGYPGLSASLFADFAAGITFVLVADIIATTGQINFDATDAPTYASSGGGYIKRLLLDIYDQAGLDHTQVAALGAGNHTIALNFSPTRVAMSVDGGSVFADTITTSGLTTLTFSLDELGSSIKSINGRALVAEADLPALSV